jgi:hypothetical protein
MGSNASIYYILAIFEVEKDVLKVLPKWLSITHAELCQFRDVMQKREVVYNESIL